MIGVVSVENLRMVAVGAGSMGLASPGNEFTGAAVDLSGAEKPNVLTIGTAEPTADYFEDFVANTLSRFGNLGAKVVNLHDFQKAPSKDEAENKIGEADVIWVAGGDTLHMIDFWRENGIDELLNGAASRGTVMGGGSAGMLAWMERGHSDSLSYRVPEGEPWDYIFVSGLGYLAVTGCPHYDASTDGAAMRETDFIEKFAADKSLPKTALGIDNMAALVVADGNYKIVKAPNDRFPRAGVFQINKTKGGVVQERLSEPKDFARFHLS